MPRPTSYLYDNEKIKLVEVLIQFCRIGEIDTINEKYQAEVSIEAKWLEKESISVYDAKVHWNPMLYVENAMQINSEQVQYHIIKDKDSEYNIVNEIRYIKGVFWERLELHHFPIDVQELSISLVSKLNPGEVKLISDDKRISFINLDAKNTFIDQQKWKLFKLVKVSDSASYDSSSTNTINDRTLRYDGSRLTSAFKPSKIVATCYCSRKPGYYLFNAYFLIFLITIIALTIFSVDCKLPQNRLQITCIILLTSVSFKWVINRSLPTISYLTSLDKYAIICIFYICMLCSWHSIVGYFWETEDARFYDFWMLISFSVLYLLINVGVLVWFFMAYDRIRRLKEKEERFLRTLKENFSQINLDFESRH